MSRADPLAGLERLARLKSDIELRHFSAWRAQLVAAEARIAALHAELEHIHDSDAAFSVPQARLANALAAECGRAIQRAEDELERMRPGFDAARAAAIREFGRSQVLSALRLRAEADRRMQAARRSGQG